jgi:hypothetical protein
MTWSNAYWPNYWSDVYWPDAVAEAEPVDLCPPFRLFKQDCEMEIKGWGATGPYMQVSPFGGASQEPPSGAEI